MGKRKDKDEAERYKRRRDYLRYQMKIRLKDRMRYMEDPEYREKCKDRVRQYRAYVKTLPKEEREVRKMRARERRAEFERHKKHILYSSLHRLRERVSRPRKKTPLDLDNGDIVLLEEPQVSQERSLYE